MAASRFSWMRRVSPVGMVAGCALALLFVGTAWAQPSDGAGAPACAACPKAACAAPSAKHIILFIGDGVQLECEIAASRYLYGTDRALSYHRFTTQEFVSTWDVSAYNRYASWMNMKPYDPACFDPQVGYKPLFGGLAPYPLQENALDSYFLGPIGDGKGPATDSASAATAMATGHKTDAGNIDWVFGDPSDGALESIGEIMRQEKGAVFATTSTVPFDHATPACFGAHGPQRDAYTDLGDDMLLKVQPDVVIGGGNPNYLPQAPNYQYINQSTYESIKSGGTPYVLAERTGGQKGEDVLAAAFTKAKADGKKVFGLFGGAGSNFEHPVPEGDGTGAVRRASDENPLLRDVAAQTLDYLRSREQGHGFFALFEQGDTDWANHSNDFAHLIGAMWDLDEAVKAAVAFVDEPGDDIDWTNTLLIVTADHANSYLRLLKPLGKGQLPKQEASQTPVNAAMNFSYPDGTVHYSTGGHTNELVMLYAKGDAAALFHQYEGSWYPGTKIIDNTQLFQVMAQAAQVGHIR